MKKKGDRAQTIATIISDCFRTLGLFILSFVSSKEVGGNCSKSHHAQASSYLPSQRELYLCLFLFLFLLLLRYLLHFLRFLFQFFAIDIEQQRIKSFFNVLPSLRRYFKEPQTHLFRIFSPLILANFSSLLKISLTSNHKYLSILISPNLFHQFP